MFTVLVTAQPPRPMARLDADAGLVSGEAVVLDVRVARLGSRVLALLIDVVVQILLALVLAASTILVIAALVEAGLMAQPELAVGRGAQTVGVVLVLVGYPVLCETVNDGRSVGKLAVGLRVVRDDGGPVGFRQAATRALVGVAVEWPGLVLPLLTWVATATVMLTDARGRRLGDLAAGTLVIHDRNPSATGYRPRIAPALVGWARTLDLTRLDDGLALDVRQLLSRGPWMVGPARERLAAALWAEVAAVTSPPPPPGLPEWAYLEAVLSERHRRTRHRLARFRSAAATLWPELLPDAGPAGSDEPAGAEPHPALRPAAPAVATGRHVPTPGSDPTLPTPVAGSSAPSPRRSRSGLSAASEWSGEPYR